MTNGKLLALFTGALVLVGGLLWALALTYTPTKNASQPSRLTPQSASSDPSPITVSTPAESLKRAKRYLEPPATRESILAAQLALRSIPMSATEYKEAQKLLARTDVDLKAAEARAKAEEITKLRDKLQVDYQRLLSDANPHLNYITTRLNKHKGGFALWAVHTYFGQYTFSIGDDAKVVSAWIERNQSELKRAGILRVGVRSSESWGGWCWFEV
jgi:hypothetical protein